MWCGWVGVSYRSTHLQVGLYLRQQHPLEHPVAPRWSVPLARHRKPVTRPNRHPQIICYIVVLKVLKKTIRSKKRMLSHCLLIGRSTVETMPIADPSCMLHRVLGSEVKLGHLRLVSNHMNVRWISEENDTGAQCWQSCQPLGRPLKIANIEERNHSFGWTGPTVLLVLWGWGLPERRTSNHNHVRLPKQSHWEW